MGWGRKSWQRWFEYCIIKYVPKFSSYRLDKQRDQVQWNPNERDSIPRGYPGFGDHLSPLLRNHREVNRGQTHHLIFLRGVKWIPRQPEEVEDEPLPPKKITEFWALDRHHQNHDLHCDPFIKKIGIYPKDNGHAEIIPRANNEKHLGNIETSQQNRREGGLGIRNLKIGIVERITKGNNRRTSQWKGLIKNAMRTAKGRRTQI